MNLKKLKKMRESHKMTQAATAAALGIHINTYLTWERGCGKPSGKNLKKLERLFKPKKGNSQC